MSKTVLIVEKDVALMQSLRDALAARGFGVDETTDGKGAPELIRSNRPDCVVLAVDLDAGQNGYLICKKLKSDDELKGVPVIIIGDPKGFANHKKLKTRAEDYVGKPLEADAIVDHVGDLVGFPPAPEEEPIADLEDAFDPSSLLDDEGTGTAVDELNIDTGTDEEMLGAGDPDFDMVDAMFDESPTDGPPPVHELDVGEEEIPLTTTAFDEEEVEEQAEKTVIGFMPSGPSEARTSAVPAFTPSSSASAIAGMDPAEARELRARVTELTGALEDARSRSSDLERRLKDMEADLESTRGELEAERASGSKGGDKETFALKDSLNKKDKEILRLKNELNTKDQEILELRDKENSLEQQVSEESGELARKDAQIKTLQTKVDQLTGDRRKIDQQLNHAREEARSAGARLSTLESDHEAVQSRISELEGEIASLQEAESARQAAESELAEARGELEAVRAQLDSQAAEMEDLRSQYEQTQIDLESARTQLTSQATSFAEEMSGLRAQVGELEGNLTDANERAERQRERVKAQQRALDEAKVQLRTVLDSLEAQPADSDDELNLDDLMEA